MIITTPIQPLEHQFLLSTLPPLQILFSFLLYTNIKRQKGELNEDEWNFLLRGSVAVMEIPEKTIPWLPNSAWDELCRLNHLETFTKVLSLFVELQDQWQVIFDAQVTPCVHSRSFRPSVYKYFDS